MFSAHPHVVVKRRSRARRLGLVAVAVASLTFSIPATAQAYSVTVRITGAGKVQGPDGPDGDVVAVNCVTPASTPTEVEGTRDGNCFEDYFSGSGPARYVATVEHASSGWAFVKWTNVRSSGVATTCDGSTSPTCDLGGLGNSAIFNLTAHFADTLAPGTVVRPGHPAGTVRSTSAAFSLAAVVSEGASETEPHASFVCQLDTRAPEHPCGAAYSGLAPGPHTFTVWARDPSGNQDLTPAVISWVVDTIPPPLPTITSGPSGRATSTSARFEFTSPESGVAFDCRLDLGAFAACALGSAQEYVGLAEGPHTFEVRARDAVGNESAAVARSWVVDTGPPETVLTETGPADGSVTASTSASFAFASEPGSTFECGIDGRPFGACSGPAFHDVTGLESGAHVFEVRAIDAVGNVDATPASRRWSVDAVPPETEITDGPAEGSTSRSGTATFAFASEPGVAFECRVDRGPFGRCSAARLHTIAGLGDGTHTFHVRAIDAVGNVESTPASRTWAVAVPALALRGARLDAAWRRSTIRPKAGLSLMGHVAGGQAGDLTITLRHARLKTLAATVRARVPAGAFAVRVSLPASARNGMGLLIPGEYAVEVAGTAGGYPVAGRTTATMPSPREGVVVSSRIVASPRKVSARFRFAPEGLPRGIVRARWLDPRGNVVGTYQVRPPNAVTWFRWLDNRPLAKGKWTCQVRVGKTIVKSVSIRVS